MSDKTGKPIEYFTAVEANRILWIALKWGPNETKKLKQATKSDFENVLATIQASPEMVEIIGDIIGDDKNWFDRHFTPQEIIRFRKTILSLLNREENVDTTEEAADEYASPKLSTIATAINGLYANWTYFDNIKMLATQVEDFFKELWKKSQEEQQERKTWGVAVKKKKYDEDDDEDDDFTGQNYYQILAGDAIVIKTIKSIIYAYIFYLRKFSGTDLDQVLEDEKSQERWHYMAHIVTNFKRFVKQPQNMRSVRNMHYDLIAELEEIFESWDAYALLLSTKRQDKKE